MSVLIAQGLLIFQTRWMRSANGEGYQGGGDKNDHASRMLLDSRTKSQRERGTTPSQRAREQIFFSQRSKSNNSKATGPNLKKKIMTSCVQECFDPRKPSRSFASISWELRMDIMTSSFTCSHEAFFANSGETSSSNVDVLSLHHSTTKGKVASSKLEVWVARRRVRFVVFESVQVLVALATHLAAVGLFLLHAKCTRVRR